MMYSMFMECFYLSLVLHVWLKWAMFIACQIFWFVHFISIGIVLWFLSHVYIFESFLPATVPIHFICFHFILQLLHVVILQYFTILLVRWKENMFLVNFTIFCTVYGRVCNSDRTEKLSGFPMRKMRNSAWFGQGGSVLSGTIRTTPTKLNFSDVRGRICCVRIRAFLFLSLAMSHFLPRLTKRIVILKVFFI